MQRVYVTMFPLLPLTQRVYVTVFPSPASLYLSLIHISQGIVR